MRKLAYLFGGGGYLGHYLAKQMLSRRYMVVNIDTKNVCKVPGVLNMVPFDSGAIQHLQQDDPSQSVLFHLACPRNKKGEWNLAEAVRSLEEGIRLSRRLGVRLVFSSSLSIHDDPASEYGNFKLAAEVAVRAVGGAVARLGTLFGAEDGMPYRADLGLHIIAEQLASGHEAWVNNDIQRHICPVSVAARDMANMLSYGQAERTISEGIIKYSSMVPPEVARRMPETDYYTIAGEPTACPDAFSRLFNRFTVLLKEKRVWPI